MCRSGWKAPVRLMRPQLRPGAPPPGRTRFEIPIESPIYPIRRAVQSFLSLTCDLGLDEFRSSKRTSWFGSDESAGLRLRGFAIVEIECTRSKTSYNADGSNNLSSLR